MNKRDYKSGGMIFILASELIKELEDFIEKIGDMPVYITKGFVADTEVDMVAYVRASQCLLGNHYLDWYSRTREHRIEELKKDMLTYASEDLDCTHCEYYDEKKGLCVDYEQMMENHRNGEDFPLTMVYRECDWKPENVFDCFEEKSHVDDEKIYNMRHYLYLLEKEKTMGC